MPFAITHEGQTIGRRENSVEVEDGGKGPGKVGKQAGDAQSSGRSWAKVRGAFVQRQVSSAGRNPPLTIPTSLSNTISPGRECCARWKSHRC